MKQFKKLGMVLLFFVFMLLLTPNYSQAGSQHLNSLQFDVSVNQDGSMNVVETWKVKIKETNTLYKTFPTDKSKYSSITDVKVVELTDGTKPFAKVNQWAYHVAKNRYYGTINQDGDFEIGWGVGLDDSSATRTYQISYTVNDAIAKYQDCAELYWQFVGKDFEVNASKITGTITLPQPAKDLEDIRVWGHTEDLNGEIVKTNHQQIDFEIKNFNHGRFVEVRVLMPTEMITSTSRNYGTNHVDTVLQEEAKWAKDANAKRTMSKMKKYTIGIVIFLVIIGFHYYWIRKIIKHTKKLKELEPKFKPEQELEYYRDMPRENATPAEALFCLKKNTSAFSSEDFGKVFSATLLDLNLKKYLIFEMDSTKKDSVIVKIAENVDVLQLPEEERKIFRFMEQCCNSLPTKQATTKDITKYIRKQSSHMESFKLDIEKKSIQQLAQQRVIDRHAKKQVDEMGTACFGAGSFIFVLIMAMAFLPALEIPILFLPVVSLMICTIINFVQLIRMSNKINVFTQKGVNESEQWKGLKKYMEDFSLLKEKEVPQIVIWEKYLVYATVFGIAEKVIKQLKTVFPELTDPSYAMNHYPYMSFILYSNFNNSFSQSISSTMASTYTSATGGGGGFSGGGGGGRRTAAVVVEDSFFLPYYFERQSK